MSPALLELFLQSLRQTVVMVGAAGAISFLLGVPLAVLLSVTGARDLLPRPTLNRILGTIVNGFRSTPFVILLVALIPFTRLIVGTSVGTTAAIVPLSIAAIAYFARIAEVSLREVDRGLIAAAEAMGASPRQVIRHVLLPEAMPGIIAGFTVTLVTLIGASAVAGAIGAGGLGDLAIRYGYQLFDATVMLAVVAVLILLVTAIQASGDFLARQLDHRH